MDLGVGNQSRVAFFLPNLEGGGAERAVAALANSVAALGIEVDLVLGEVVGPYVSEVSRGVNLVDLGANGVVGSTVRLARYLTRRRPDVVMSCLDVPNMQLVAAAKFSGFKGAIAIGQRATLAPVYAHFGLLRRVIYGLGIRRTYPSADLVICNSHAAAGEVRAIRGVQGSKVKVIHNSVDSERINRLAREPLEDAWLAMSDAPLVLSVGNLTRLKDRVTLVKSFARLRSRREARLVILGAAYEPAESDKVNHLIAELGIADHVYLPGFDSNPYRWMAHAAVLVSSSVTEGCPNQLLEGLALSASIVATDCPGDTGELLEHGKWGRLVPVADPEAMADAMLAALDDPDPPHGPDRAADFDPSKVTAEYLNVLLRRAGDRHAR